MFLLTNLLKLNNQMETGIIIKGVSGQYEVATAKGIYICKPRGLFRRDDFKPLCGDIADFEITDVKDREGYILKIHERKNSLVRPLVANVDKAVIVFSINDPKCDTILMDLLILACRQNGIEPVMCLNKTDLSDEDERQKISDEYRGSGYLFMETDAKHNIAMDKLKEVLQNGISIFAGQSGVGKSTIINAILEHIFMETGELSLRISRGKNTTRHCELLPYGGGYIADSPGFSKFDPGLLDPDGIAGMYNEFKPYEGQCKFNDCRHICETGCAVINAINEGNISMERHSRYKIIYNMAKQAEKLRRGY
ncbi:MAG: ribosome small subunit-dependent GTPase A [Clostridia bacterium]